MTGVQTCALPISVYGGDTAFDDDKSGDRRDRYDTGCRGAADGGTSGSIYAGGISVRYPAERIL